MDPHTRGTNPRHSPAAKGDNKWCALGRDKTPGVLVTVSRAAACLAKGVRATGPYPVFVNTPQKRVVPNTQCHRIPREPKRTEPQAPCPEFVNSPPKRVVSALKITSAYAHDRVAALELLQALTCQAGTIGSKGTVFPSFTPCRRNCPTPSGTSAAPRRIFHLSLLVEGDEEAIA